MFFGGLIWGFPKLGVPYLLGVLTRRESYYLGFLFGFPFFVTLPPKFRELHGFFEGFVQKMVWEEAASLRGTEEEPYLEVYGTN